MVQFPVGARDFLIFKALRLALGLTQLAVQSFFPGSKVAKK